MKREYKRKSARAKTDGGACSASAGFSQATPKKNSDDGSCAKGNDPKASAAAGASPSPQPADQDELEIESQADGLMEDKACASPDDLQDENRLTSVGSGDADARRSENDDAVEAGSPIKSLSLSGLDSPTKFSDRTELERINNNNNKASLLDLSRLNTQKNLSTHHPMAATFYSSLNLLASQAFYNNIKREPVDASERFSKASDGQLTSNYNNNIRSSSTSPSELGDRLRPPAELSPDTFAEQLRQNDGVSMVVRRGISAKSASQSMMSPESGISSSVRTNGSSLHHFVTRYTIEHPEDPSRLGVDICLESNDQSEPVLEIECGGNKGLLYVTKLCQGSKGQSIYFNEEWLTPNEFQFISGRETAKDWKRSIRHCGKSLKTLMSKGILQVHPPVCECDYCRRQGPGESIDMMARKRSQGLEIQENHKQNSPYASKPTTPLALIPPDSAGSSSKQGREGGLNSIISQLHSLKSSHGFDRTSDESLDLSLTSGGSSSLFRKRQSDYREGNLSDGEDGRASKRAHFDATASDATDVFERRNDKTKRRSHTSDRDRPKVEANRSRSSRNESGSGSLNRNWLNEQQQHFLSAASFNPYFDNIDASFRHPASSAAAAAAAGMAYSEYALYDAMKRAVQTVAAHPNGYSFPNQAAALTSPQGQGRKQALVELTSRSRRNEERNFNQDSEYGKAQNHNGDEIRSLSRDPTDRNNNWVGLPTPPSGESPRHAYRNGSKPVKTGSGSKYSNNNSSSGGISSGNSLHRSRNHHVTGSQSNQPGGQKMVNLNNHAIPMMSLTYRKRRADREEVGKDTNGSRKRITNSSPPVLVHGESDYSKDQRKTNDALRRLSSSAPPPVRHTFPSNRSKSVSPQTKHQRNFFHNGSFNPCTPPVIASDQASLDSNAASPPTNDGPDVTKRLFIALEEMGQWSVDDVCAYVCEIGCGEYEEVFREKSIDGDGLPLLVERHLVDQMGMKLGHALKLIAKVQRRLGNHVALLTPKQHTVGYVEAPSTPTSSISKVPDAEEEEESPRKTEEEEDSGAVEPC